MEILVTILLIQNSLAISKKIEIESVKVPKIQKKRVLHSIKGLNKRNSCRPIFNQLKILTLRAMLCYIKKHNIYLSRNLNKYEYNTRTKCDFHVLSCNISLLKRSAINVGIRLYKMPTKVKKLESFRDFQKKLKCSHWISFYLLNGSFIFEEDNKRKS